MTSTEHASADTVTPGTLLGVGMWFGSLAGLLEVGYQAYRKLIEHEFLWVSRDFVWMAPLGDAALFVSIALLIAVMSRGKAGLRGATVVFAAAAAMCEGRRRAHSR